MKTIFSIIVLIALAFPALAQEKPVESLPRAEINALAKGALKEIKTLKGEVEAGNSNIVALQKGIDAQAETIKAKDEKIKSLEGGFFKGLVTGLSTGGLILFLVGLAIGSGVLAKLFAIPAYPLKTPRPPVPPRPVETKPARKTRGTKK